MESHSLSTEIIHKEIDLIQSCINRMQQNSFFLKGWLVSIVAVIIALVPNKSDSKKLILIIAVVICFWYLDGFYLKLERLYRRKYDWVIVERLKENSSYLYDLNPYNNNMWEKPNEKNITILYSMFSATLLPFYGLTILLVFYFYFK